MRDIVVALDLETTGLSAQDDAIIQFGAVKFQGERVIEIYDTLINPERPIPPRATAISHISNEDVAGKPKLSDVLPDIKRFIGDYVVLGHNTLFDVDFLRAHGLPLRNPIIDTYEMASVLLPTTPRYNLGALMQELALEVDGEYHSALTDSKATMQVYLALWDRLNSQVPLQTLQSIVTATQELPWLGRLPFEAALEIRQDRPQLPIEPSPAAVTIMSAAASISAEPITLLAPIDDALRMDQHLIVEVPRGMGRTGGYALAALSFATERTEQVLVGTYNTYNTDTQDQLVMQAIPAAASKLGVPENTAILKARGFYLCPRRLETLRRRPPTSIEELRVLGKILVWGEAAWTSDRDGISLRGPAEYLAWARLSAADELCTTARCSEQTGGACPFYKACQSAGQARLILVDQGLLFSDEGADDAILPKANYLIVDEAHRLEEAATAALSTRLDLADFRRLLADLGSLDSGLIGDLIQVISVALSETQRERTTAYLEVASEAVRDMAHHGGALFDALSAFIASEVKNRSDYLVQLRVTDSMREKTAFEPVRAAWSVLRDFTSAVADAMSKMSSRLESLRDRLDDAALPDLIASTRAAAMHLQSVHRQLARFIEKPDNNAVYWLETGSSQPAPTIRSGPLHVAPIAQERLWNTHKSVILTGTTLQVSGSLDYVREQLGAPQNAQEQIVPSAANYEDTVLIYLPTDIPEPMDKQGYQRSIERAIIELGTVTEGQMLALFTGFEQLRQTAQAIAPRLALGGITLLDQSAGTSRQALVEGFRDTEKAILMGGRSLWEELELPPEKLAALVITRLPFAPPGDPLLSARGELMDDSFMMLSVPDAVLRFRQAFDRLTRPLVGKRGVVTVLDRRISSKNYGQKFLESLPACTVKRGPLADLAGAAKTWLVED